ncbi:hypothetical protein MNBD_GAMMA25-421 [hydrothermal vent metagenome]|uniref:Lipocalin-like domain-containing protein n=1 Tax=hydrothermal vent metagenome TaxID=652676 RepID=A0A3B1AQ75_9ZZZZ
MFNVKIWSLVATLALLSACGGGDVAINPAIDPADVASLEVTGLNGIWEGDYTDAVGKVCNDARGLIYNGQVRVISTECDVILSGTLSTKGTTASINFELFDAAATRTGQADFSGSYTQQSQINGNLDNGGRLNLSYNIVYENDSSLKFIAGNWYYTDATVSSVDFLSIDVNGNATEVSESGAPSCSYTASFSIINSDFNLYAVSVGVSNCPDDQVSRNGNYTGVASLSGDNGIITVFVGNDQNVFIADFNLISLYEVTK